MEVTAYASAWHVCLPHVGMHALWFVAVLYYS
jgi:hypothetical protein